MRRRLFFTILGSYITFFTVSFLVVLLLVPRVLQKYLFEIADDADYHAYLNSQAVAIQNSCYLLIAVVFVLSLFPLAIFHLKLYRPLDRISETAARYVSGESPKQLTYNQDDELGRLTASLNYLIETAENSDEYQRRFISNISHDFRSPLTSIKGYVEAILDGTIPPEMQERYLKIVLSETERLNKLTDGILLLNNFDDHRIYLDLTDFDLAEVIRQSIDTFEGLCEKKNLTIQTDFPKTPLFVNADKSRIQQVLYNLIDNAIKFSYPGNEIVISVHEQKKLYFVSVKDFGEGISPENQTQIWDRFFKTDPSRGRDKKGTGLGLSIVKEIILAHNQNINVISTKDIGTEFVFTLARSNSSNPA